MIGDSPLDGIDLDELFTATEICRLTGISRGRVESWRTKGFLPETKVGKRVLYRWSDVLDCVREHMEKKPEAKHRIFTTSQKQKFNKQHGRLPGNPQVLKALALEKKAKRKK